ncbi:hypothetical protein Trydic_g22737 [Trypoxylus dichotomus]
MRNLLLRSAYLPYDQEGPPPTSEVKALMSYAEAHKLQFLLGCDPNAHHTIWGSTDTNKRGESLISHFVTNGLVTLNRGNKPTFVTVSKMSYRNPRNCNWGAYRERLIEELERCPRRIKTAVDIELLAESLQSAIITSYEASCPVKIRSTNRDTPWWTRELSELRTATRKLYNKCKKSGSWDKYKASLTRYNRALTKTKRYSWKRFCQELGAVPECSRIRKVLAREGPSRIGTLSKSDGTKAETEEQVLQHLLEVHFPGSEIIQTQFGGECKGLSPQIPDFRARRVDWNLTRKIIQVFKIRCAIESFKPFKSAGMDGIFPALLQQGQDLLSPVLCTLLRATLAMGHLPSSWREARLAFIPKQGETSYTAAKSYQPISLTSFLLKTLEKIIDKYLRDSALGRLPLHENQYAYQTGKSWEQAIHELARRAEIAFRHKEIALGFLNLETGRPSCQWSELCKDLESSQRSQGMTVVADCPQGGVLSPLLWCLLVDDLLSDLRRAGFYA